MNISKNKVYHLPLMYKDIKDGACFRVTGQEDYFIKAGTRSVNLATGEVQNFRIPEMSVQEYPHATIYVHGMEEN